MTMYLDIATKIIIAIAFLGMFVILASFIFKAETLPEALLRCLSLLAGFLVFLSAKILKISIPKLLGQAAEAGGLIQSAAWSMLLPALIGLALAAFFAAILKRGGNRQVRALIVISTLVYCSFCDLFYVRILKNPVAESYIMEITSREHERDKLYANLRELPQGEGSQSVEERNAKRIKLTEEISKIDIEIESTEKARMPILIAEFGPNVTFILGILFYAIFLYDRKTLGAIKLPKVPERDENEKSKTVDPAS